ncbi:MAG TPA: hypothetical protein VMW39_01165 [bacterium]|nr:hypothetical protein [bacterium]
MPISGWWGIFLSGCFLAATRELMQRSRRISTLNFFIRERKNIKIAPAIGGALAQKRISFFLFAPFNFLFSETEKKLQCQKNQKLTKICQKKSTSVPSVEPWFVLYKLSHSFINSTLISLTKLDNYLSIFNLFFSQPKE